MALSTAEIKLLAVKAKNYSSSLYGVKNIKFLVADAGALKWHRSALQQLLTLKGVAMDKLAGPYSKIDAMQWVASRLKFKKGAVVNILFEDFILISFEIVDAEEFLLGAVHAAAGKGFSLFLLNPDAVILVHDSGNELALYRTIRQAAYR